MTKGPISTAKRAPVTAGAASRRGGPGSTPAGQPTTPGTRAPARTGIGARRTPRRLLVAWRVAPGGVAGEGAPTDPPTPPAAPVPEGGPPRVSRPPSRPR